MSTYDLLGFPSSIAVTLFTLALVIALIPLFHGRKVAGLDIPEPGAGYPRVLARFGWTLAVVAGAAFFPVWARPAPADDPSKPFDAEVRVSSDVSPPLDCGRVAGTVISARVDPEHVYKATVDASCAATIRGIDAKYRSREVRLE